MNFFNTTNTIQNGIEHADRLIKSLEQQKKTTQKMIDSWSEKRQKLVDQLEKLKKP
jgi:phage-related tail protein